MLQPLPMLRLAAERFVSVEATPLRSASPAAIGHHIAVSADRCVNAAQAVVRLHARCLAGQRCAILAFRHGALPRMPVAVWTMHGINSLDASLRGPWLRWRWALSES